MKAAERLEARDSAGTCGSRWAAHRPAAAAAPAVAGAAFHGETAKYRGAARIKDALAIELDRIMPDPDQPRKEFDPEALADLAASLKARGQLQPIRVRWDEADRAGSSSRASGAGGPRSWPAWPIADVHRGQGDR